MIKNIIWEDLKFFLTRLKALSNSETLQLGNEGGFCVSTCCNFESWIYYPERITNSDLVNEAVRFFRERDISFMWPVYDGGNEFLESAGLLYAGDLTAMMLERENFKAGLMNDAVSFERICSEADAKEFARNVWHGFDGEAEAIPENYCALMSGLNADRENLSLYLAKYEGMTAGTFLVTNEPELMGVYYFSVLPEFRRKGIARTMMNEICRLSAGKRIVLQATPAGVKFYEATGFEELFKIHVYSTEMEIF